MNRFFLVTVFFFTLLLSCFSGVAVKMSESTREIREENLSRTRALLEEKRAGLPAKAVEILEVYCSSMENELCGDERAEVLNLIEAYELSEEERREYEARGKVGFGTLWKEFGADYGRLPSDAALTCNQSDNIHPEQKLELMNRISCVAPWDDRAHRYFGEILERWWPYPAIIRFCERKEAAGYGYYRFMRVKMLIHYQCQRIEKAAVKRYKDVVDRDDLYTLHYEPGLVEHKEFELAIHEARTDPDLTPFRLRDYAELFARQAWRAVEKKEEILEYLDFARETALKHIAEEEKQEHKEDSKESDWAWALRGIDELKVELLARKDTADGAFRLRSLQRTSRSKAIEAKIESGEWAMPGVDALNALLGDCPDTASEQSAPK